MAFKSLFLKGYSGVDEDDYSIAVYTKQSVYDSLQNVINQVCICFFIYLFVLNFFLLCLYYHYLFYSQFCWSYTDT